MRWRMQRLRVKNKFIASIRRTILTGDWLLIRFLPATMSFADTRICQPSSSKAEPSIGGVWQPINALADTSFCCSLLAKQATISAN